MSTEDTVAEVDRLHQQVAADAETIALLKVEVADLEAEVADLEKANEELSTEVQLLKDERADTYSMLRGIKETLIGAIANWTNTPEKPRLLINPEDMELPAIAKMVRQLVIDLVIAARERDGQLGLAKEQVAKLKHALNIINKISAP